MAANVQGLVRPLVRGLVTPLSGAGGSAPVLINFAKSQFTTWKAGVARVIGATGRARLLVVGDSTTRGVGSGDSGQTYLNAKLYGYVTKTGQQLAALGVTCNMNDFMGSGAVAIANINQYGAGMNVGAGWVVSSAQTMAGFCLANNVDATTIVFTPPFANQDHFEFFYPTAAAAGVGTYAVDGGTAIPVTETGANGFTSVQIAAGSVGAHNLTLTRTSGNFYMAGLRAWDSTTPAVDIINLGASGWKAADWDTSAVPYNALGALTSLAATADLVIIDLTINDAVVPTVTATYTTQIQAIINAVKGAGSASILLLTGNPSDASYAALANQSTIRAAYKALALSNNLPMIDQVARDISYLVMNAKGWMFDTAHENKLGHADLGQFLGNTLYQWAQ